MASNLVEWQVQCVDGRTKRPRTETGKLNVLNASLGTRATIFSDEFGTVATQPLSMTNGVARWFTASSVTSLDVAGLIAGHGFFIRSMVPSTHREDIWPENEMSTLAVPYEYNATVTASQFDTGLDLPTNVLVREVFVDALVASTGGVMTMGVSTTPTGFLIVAPVTVTGVTGLNESTSQVLGALLAFSATNFFNRIKYQTPNATSGARIVYTNTTSTSTAGSGFVYLKLDRIQSRS